MPFMYEPAAQSDFILTVVGSPWGWLATWLLIINGITFFVFGVDKLKAKRKVKRESVRRVPERTLFFLTAVGGSAGALLGMKIWRHKTLHKTFRYGIPLIFLLHILLVAGLCVYLNFIR